MATYTVKKGKITGTSKKDKIGWKGQRDWQRALTVKAGKDNDVINFAASFYNKNKLYGDDGRDKIIGGSKIDYIYGGSGNDTLLGNSGNDRIYAGAGNDLIDGGKNDDKIWGESGCNAITGNDGNDTIYGGVGYDAIDGGNGQDVIYLQKGTEEYASYTLTLGKKNIKLNESKRTFVLGGKGNDKILRAQGGAYINAGDGKDTITAISGSNTIYGGAGDDSITISSIYSNTICGGDGSDIIKSGAGHDVIKGEDGRDNITAGSGDDSIYGGTSNDTINAGEGYNMIYFKRGEGTDDIISGGGYDTLVFMDDSFETIRAWVDKENNNDLIIKGGDATSWIRARLKDYFSGGEHSVKQVQDKNGEIRDITEIRGVPPRVSMALMQAPLLAARVAWETQKDASSYIEDFTPTDKEPEIIPPFTTNNDGVPFLS